MTSTARSDVASSVLLIGRTRSATKILDDVALAACWPPVAARKVLLVTASGAHNVTRIAFALATNAKLRRKNY
jgi:hypothetical protein